MSNSLIVLAFDTSVTGCSVCVGNDTASYHESLSTERGQAELLVPLIKKVMANSGHVFGEIDRIGVTIGPGSFTGVRVGLSTAKALALTLNKPLLGFSTLEVLAQGIKEKSLILIDTKRDDFYGQIFENGEARSEASIWSKEAVLKYDGPTMINSVPDMNYLAMMIRQSKLETNVYNPQEAPSPLYLRGAEISQSKRTIPTLVNLDEDVKSV